MPVLLVVGGGLFGSLAAAYARSQGIEAIVFDPGLPKAASLAAAGLFREEWTGKRLSSHYANALPVLECLYGIDTVSLADEDGLRQPFLFVPPTRILEREPVRSEVTSIGDGWLEAGGRRWTGNVYVAAGVWCERFLPSLKIIGKSGSAFSFACEREGVIRPWAPGRQAIAFVRDPGLTHFSDGTAEVHYSPEHERETLARAAELGLTNPVRRYHGMRPYTPGGPVFLKLSQCTWLATGGRKLGTLLGASFARRLVEEEL